MDKAQRAFFIYSLIKNKKVDTITDIRNILVPNYIPRIHRRTIERDIDYLKDVFRIPITFDRSENRYIIEDFGNPDNELGAYIEQASFWQSTLGLEPGTNIKQYLRFDNRYNPEIQLIIAPLLKAIVHRVKVQFQYQKFGEDQGKTVTVHPYELKEHHYNWYLGGFEDGQPTNKKTYGLDRIDLGSLILLTEQESFDRLDGYDTTKEYIGVNGSGSKHVVKFRLSRWWSDNLSKNKLHHSQRKISDLDDGSSVFEVDLRVNHELFNEFLRMGSNCTLLSPPQVVTEFKQRLSNMLKNYPD